MEKFDSLLKELKELDITQTQGDWAENLPEEIWEKHFKQNFKELSKGLEVDTHRWYELSTTVIKIYGRYLGIHFITKMFSQIDTYEDACITMQFFEMEEIETISYKRK